MGWSATTSPRPSRSRPWSSTTRASASSPCSAGGLVPKWAKDLKVGYRMINAKAETIAEKKTYAPLIGKTHHRALLLADGYYEWQRPEDPKQPRQPFRFTVDDGAFFTNAGEDVHGVGSLAPLIPGAIGCIMIRPDGSRVLARVASDPLAQHHRE
jgi:SOS response associated peptidase (SRAP)